MEAFIMENTKLLTVEEAAKLLKCHHLTIRRMVWRNKLPCIRVGNRIRIPEKALEVWLERAMKKARLPVAS
jgi:excisionase family DNA binding protein